MKHYAAMHTLLWVVVLGLFLGQVPPALPTPTNIESVINTSSAGIPSIALPPVDSLSAPQPFANPQNTPAHALIPKLTTPANTQLPFVFEKNIGQTDSSVRFRARTVGGIVSFTPDEIILALPPVVRSMPMLNDTLVSEHTSLSDKGNAKAFEYSQPTVRVRYIGARSAQSLVGVGQLPGVVNYFVGNNPSKWRTNIPTYSSIIYHQLYDGVSLHYTGTGQQLKSTFEVSPGADPSQIRWQYTGITKIHTDNDGNLVVMLDDTSTSPTGTQTLIERAPIAWQDGHQGREPVVVQFEVQNGIVQFAIGSYDRTRPLIIDPTLEYSTYLGGSGSDMATDITTDQSGAIYITGTTTSIAFPSSNSQNQAGSGDLFVTKLAADGRSLIYTTYLGGPNADTGNANAYPSIAVDAYDNVYIAGATRTNGFPTTANAYQANYWQDVWGSGSDVIAVKLNNSGSQLLYSTYIGRQNDDYGTGIAVDQQGIMYIVGAVVSGNFPLKNPLQSQHGGSTMDALVLKLDPSKSNGADTLIYSTFLGGNKDDFGKDIALDNDGNILVTGWTESSSNGIVSFPATPGVSQSSFGGQRDAFITKLNGSGSQILYSSYLGGTQYEEAFGLAVDDANQAYITGWTSSSNFPVANAYQSSYGGGSTDAFITALSPTGDLRIYSTYLGGSGNDYGHEIGVDQLRNAFVTGQTRNASLFPLGVARLPFNGSSELETFVAALPSTGTPLLSGTFLGGTSDDVPLGLAVSRAGKVLVTGYTVSTDFDTKNALQSSLAGGSDAYISIFDPVPTIPNDQIRTPERCPCASAQPSVGGPVNTRTGNLWTSVTDLSISSEGPPLSWRRVYASQAITDTTSAISPGWQHSFAARLITPAMSGGESGRVIILSPGNNRLRFSGTGTGPFRAAPGVYDSLIADSTVYTQTLQDQTQYVYQASDGRLLRVRDKLGRLLTLSYSAGQLIRVEDSRDTTRFFAITYANGRINQVSDGSRSVIYAYDVNGNLNETRDVLNRATTYGYHNQLLVRITNSLGQDLEQSEYDVYTASGKVISQTLQDGRRFRFTYLPNTTIITTTGLDGRQDVHQFDYALNNTLVGVRTNGQPQASISFDSSLNPGIAIDGNNNTTRTIYSVNGLPLLQTDALTQTTQFTYDSYQRPLSISDTLGNTTRYRYDSFGNVISATVGLGSNALTTLLRYQYRQPNGTWTTSESNALDSRPFEEQRPDGIVTRSFYDNASFPRAITRTVFGYGTTLAQTTQYGYDLLGRVTDVTVAADSSLARRTHTQYNADNTIAHRIENYVDGIFDAQRPDEDIITSYGYDGLGRQSWVRNALGHYDVTHYNTRGQIDWAVRNFVVAGWSGGVLPSSPPTFNPTTPDRNIATLYQYDGLGRTALVTETGILGGTFNPQSRTYSQATTRTTRTEYDELSRPITTTLNYRSGIAPSADTNVVLATRYDGVGNIVWQSDARNVWTKTEYDALNRPVRTITNYEDGNPLTGPRDADLITETKYRADGQVERQIANRVTGIFTTTQPITDRVTLFAYDTIGRPTTTIENWAPGLNAPELNRTSTNNYDTVTGRVVGQKDPLGRWVSQQYDALGRVTGTIQNCRNASGQAVPTGCAAFSAAIPDRNVLSEARYDALGRVFETVDPLSFVTRTTFDGLGRTTATIKHYVDGIFDPNAPDTDVTVSRTFDALGRVLLSTDPTNATTRFAYDALGRTTTITDTASRVTHSGYDGTGAQRWTATPDGRLTVSEFDGLGRVTATIVNFQNGVADTGDAVDEDLITRTVYDVAGRRIRTIDPMGRITQFAYDNVDRLIAVTENVRDDCASLPAESIHRPCNVITRYEYDRAGNRTAIVDANTHRREFVYDAANQLVTQTDALNQNTRWEYDASGRVLFERDPRGANYDLSYTYDELDRQLQLSSAQLSAAVTAQYDALGRRTSLSDATGITSFGYDALGRITSVSAPHTGTIGYGYNARGDRTRLTYPDSSVINYDYHPDGQLWHVLQGTTPLATYGYDGAGRLSHVLRANGALTNYGYDDADYVRDIHTTVQGETVSRFQYTLDELGLRRAATETLGRNAPAATPTPTTPPASSPTPSATSTATPTPTGSFYRAINLGGSAVTIDGHAWEGSSTANYSTNGSTLCNEWISWNPSTDTNRATMLSCWVQHWEHQLAMTSVPSGDYDVYLYVQQDWDDPDSQPFTLTVEGTSAGGWTPGAAGSWAKLGPFRRTIADGSINVTSNGMANIAGFEVWAAGGTSPTSTPTATSTPTSQPSGGEAFYRAINLGGSAVTIDGHAWEGSSASNYSTNGSTLCNEWISWNPATDANRATMLSCWVQHWAHQLEMSSVPAGTYDVYLYVQQDWDDPDAQPFALEVEGASASGWTPGAAGSWAKLGPFRRMVSDGTISVTTGGMANIAGFEVWSIGSGTSATATPTTTATTTPTSAPGGTVQMRVVTYDYDALNRLVKAVESPGETTSYGYDLAGNRTSVTRNGVQTSYAYNAANQVIGWTYDAAGNLLSDGTTSYSYDALDRVLSTTSGGTTRTHAYNGDGVRVGQSVGGVTTRYAQDLAAPLNQVLADGSASYIYGHERLAGVQGGARTWYSGDALGSVRLTLSDAGAPLGTANYDAWGTPEQSLIAPFGFTGELQDAAGLVDLRARWYNPGTGTFTAQRWRTDEAWDEIPYSHHVYQYGYSNPVLFTDASGKYACDTPNIHGSSGYIESSPLNPELDASAAYKQFCLQQKGQVDTRLDVGNAPNSVIQTNALGALVSLFADTGLPGGSAAKPQQLRRKTLTAAAERLEFVLWYTAGEGRFSHDRVRFSDTGFAEEFRDGHLWTNADGSAFVSNQVNHFLTAADLAYRFGNTLDSITDSWARGCLIGHELYGQGQQPELYQCTIGVSDVQHRKFMWAIASDVRGDYCDRDRLISEILPGLPESGSRGRLDQDPRRGNSRQDLRLSIKGWLFGKAILNGQINTTDEASNWLASNLAP
jgi:RHS repeat-associated protein